MQDDDTHNIAPLLPEIAPIEPLGDMVQLLFTPSGRRGFFTKGTPILTAARRLGVDLDTLCGGRGICGRCQITPSFGEFSKLGIKANQDNISDFNKVEARYQDKRGLKEKRRLGCQAKLMGDMVVDIPPESQLHRQIIRKDADLRKIRIDPFVTLHYLEVEEPDMHNPSGDYERIKKALKEQWHMTNVTISLAILQRCQRILREGNWKVTVALHNRKQIIAIWPGFQDQAFGAAIDIGSTTMSVHLTNLRTGEVAASTGAMNPQIRFGEDLMSRVSYAMMNENGAEEMTKAVRERMVELLIETAESANIEPNRILELVMVGNPIMHHLMLGIDPTELGWAPFALTTNDAVDVNVGDIDLDGAVNSGARAYFLPCVAGHVGADAAAVVVSTSPHTHQPLTLIVDIGTNAEIILGNKEKLLACSSPTGPALEGAQISSGQRAANGAIERVRIDKDTLEPRYKVIGCDLWSNDKNFNDEIGEKGITGICGSGIIEVIGEMFLSQIITHDGVIDGAMAKRNPRIRPDHRTFKYVLRDETEDNPEIAILQSDIRAIQLAKAALYAGAQLLIEKFGRSPEKIILAGAFGSHIEPLYAMILGLIPDCDLKKVIPAGNAAGTGARIALLDRKARERIRKTVKDITKIETAIEPKFQEHFINAMAFPHKTAPSPHLSAKVSLPPRKVFEDKALGQDGEARHRRRRRDRN